MKSPRSRARAFLRWLDKSGAVVTFKGALVVADEVEDRLAEEFADALDELREGFLRKPTKRDPHIHGGQGRI